MNSQRGQAVLISLQDSGMRQRYLVHAFPCGALAQLGERLICIQEVIGSIPIGSTNPPRRRMWRARWVGSSGG
jgi:hypothetical protein